MAAIYWRRRQQVKPCQCPADARPCPANWRNSHAATQSAPPIAHAPRNGGALGGLFAAKIVRKTDIAFTA